MGGEEPGEPCGAAAKEQAWEWPRLPPLEGVKSRKRAVLWVKHRDASGEQLALSLEGRAAVAGLSADETSEILRELSSIHAADRTEERAWHARGHEALEVAVLPAGGDCVDAEASLAEAAAAAPHALVVPASAALAWGRGALEAVRGFRGVLLVVEDQQVTPASAKLLQDLGVTARWQVEALGAEDKLAAPVLRALVSVPLPVVLEDDEVGKHRFLHDVQIRSPIEPEMYPEAPLLAELLTEQLAPLYDEEFGADLDNLGRSLLGYDMRLSLMVEQRPAGEAPELLGFVAYKVWGEPQPCVSVCAVGVPQRFRGCGYGRRLMAVAEDQAALCSAAVGRKDKGLVCLRSFPSSVRFYTRLGYEKTDEAEALPEGMAEDDDDGPCVPMVRRCGTPTLKSAPAHSAKPLDPWSPRRSRHLEDGPTWMPADKFALPPAAAAAA